MFKVDYETFFFMCNMMGKKKKKTNKQNIYIKQKLVWGIF